MKTLLWLRKSVEKLVGSSKGFSSVVGTVFMVLVVMLLSTGVFLWTLSQNTLYNQAVMQKNQTELDRLNEKVTASNVNYTVAGNLVSVQVALQNQGPLSAQIVSLWVIDATLNKYNFSSPLNINMKPGNTTTLTGANAIKVKIIGALWSDQLSSWFVTARGNVVPPQSVGGLTVAQVSAGIGSVSMDFSSFFYYNVSITAPWALSPWLNGGNGYNINSKGGDVAFKVRLTNFDYPQKRDITLSSHSIFWALFPSGGTQQRGAPWFIVNVNNSGIIANTFKNVTLPYGAPTDIFFASANDMSAGFTGGQKFPSMGGVIPGAALVTIALIGQIGTPPGTPPYGQNLPFAAIYVNS